jgi:hypothetical protein
MTADDWNRLYAVLVALEVPQPAMNFPHPKQKDDPLPLAWPKQRIGICFDHNDPKAWTRIDWRVFRLTRQLARELPGPLRFISDVAFAHRIEQLEADAKQTTSRTERVLLEAIMRAGLPEPDRNVEIRNDEGRLLTIPDFAWGDRHLAVFLDGWAFHAGKEAKEALTAAAKDAGHRKVVQDRIKTKASSDAAARAWMTANGWTVIAVGDGTVDEGAQALANAVDNICTTWARLDHSDAARSAP